MKSIAPITPYGYTIFCDDIRQEAGGKTSLMGIYAGTIEISQPLPFSFPKFCFSINYMERPGESTEPVALRIYLPDDAEDAPTFKADLPIDQMRAETLPADSSSTDPVTRLTLSWVVAPMVLNKAGRLRVRAYRGDLEIRLGTILVNAPPSAEQETAIGDQSGASASPN